MRCLGGGLLVSTSPGGPQEPPVETVLVRHPALAGEEGRKCPNTVHLLWMRPWRPSSAASDSDGRCGSPDGYPHGPPARDTPGAGVGQNYLGGDVI